MNKIDYLVISSTIDYSTDLVCYELLKQGKKYYRVNRDEFKLHTIIMDLEKKSMFFEIEGECYIAEFDSLKGIYYRAPVFLRIQSKDILSIEEQLEKSQWSAFLRNLIVFEKANWINNPVDTYRAENKGYQLLVAESKGLIVPKTYITNDKDVQVDENSLYVVKGIDTALLYDMKNGAELFTYTTVLKGSELKECNLHCAPVFVQEYLGHKVDCRITYVDGKCFPVKITSGKKGVFGDWRKNKNEVEYQMFELPDDIKSKITNFMEELKLKFGGIDLIQSNGKYYFIEVNPTGEWAWLEDRTGMNISKEIASAL